jgi:hypothetical protein
VHCLRRNYGFLITRPPLENGPNLDYSPEASSQR